MKRSAQAGSVAVFARNEARNLDRCLRCVAESGMALSVTTIVNGSSDGSLRVAEASYRTYGIAGSVYEIEFGDKSNAINQYFYRLRPPSDVHFMMDGYSHVAPGSLARLAARLAEDAHANAAAAVPSVGRSAAALRASMMAQGGLHGSLFALRAGFIERVVAMGLRLPVGLYRGDGLLGSMLMYDLDPVGNSWDTSRIAVEPSATWSMPVLRLTRPGDVMRQMHRMVRQAQGRLESAAIRERIEKGGFVALPADVRTLIETWRAGDPARRATPRSGPFMILASLRLRRFRLPDEAAMMPRLRWASEG